MSDEETEIVYTNESNGESPTAESHESAPDDPQHADLSGSQKNLRFWSTLILGALGTGALLDVLLA